MRNYAHIRIIRHVFHAGMLLCVSGLLQAQVPVPFLWEQESGAAVGSFSRHLDSLTGVYQQIWADEFEKGMDEAALQSKLESKRQLFLDLIGPLPEKTPLNAKVAARIDKEGYSVEKVIFESRPSFYVTALYFQPDPREFEPPYPGVLIPCGHSEAAKGHDEYQAMGALCALNGLSALVFDPVDQGERHQLLDEKGLPLNWGTRSHNLEGIRANLLGRHLASYFIWDGIRALDYLLSRNEVDPERLGISGNSGGGTQTSYLFMVDDRLKAAAPSCYIHTIFSQARLEMGDAEQNLFGQIRDGLDHADYVMMNAPRPHKTLAATHDFFRIYATWDTYRYVKRYYTSLGYSERVGILENNAGHNYNRQQREAAVQWMLRWLSGRDEVVREPDIELLTPEEYTVTSAGSVMEVPGARTINDLFKDDMENARERRERFLSNTDDPGLKEMIRELTGMNYLSDEPPVVILEKTNETGSYTTFEYRFTSVEGYIYRGSLFQPAGTSAGSPVLFLSEGGSTYHLREIMEMVNEGHSVMSVELPGTGRFRQKNINGMRLSSGMNWEDCNKAFLMGRSIVGYRIRDILDATRFLSNYQGKGNRVSLVATGETGIPALHAAFMDSSLYEAVNIRGSISSWEEVVRSRTSLNQLVNVVFDVLNHYDLPDLVFRLGKKVTTEEPVTATGLLPKGRGTKIKLSNEPVNKGLAGIYYRSPGQVNPEGPDWTGDLELSWDQQTGNRGRDWSSEWFGFLESPVEGQLCIRVSSDQSAKLFVRQELATSLEPGTQPEEVCFRVREGEFLPLRILYSQDGPLTSYLQVRWSWEGEPFQLIPPEYLWHSPRQRQTMENRWKKHDE